VLQEPRDARQRLQMRARRVLGSDQEEEEVRRIAVERLEIDPLPAAGERGEHPLDARELAVRDRHPFAERGAVQALAAFQGLDEPLAVELRMSAGDCGRELDQHVDLGPCAQIGKHELRGENVLDLHGLRSYRWAWMSPKRPSLRR